MPGEVTTSNLRPVDPFAKLVHDLNNSLLIINAQLELAREAVDREHPAYHRLASLASAAERAIQLTRELGVVQGRFNPDEHSVIELSPTAVPRNASPETLNASSSSPTRPTLLLVEDEAGIRGAMAESLQGKGYKVITAADAEGCFDCMARHQGAIDVIITDLGMPGINGISFSAEVPKLHPETKVLFISGEADGESLIGSEKFLAKPFSLAALAEKVEEILHSPQLRAAIAGD